VISLNFIDWAFCAQTEAVSSKYLSLIYSNILFIICIIFKISTVPLTENSIKEYPFDELIS